MSYKIATDKDNVISVRYSGTHAAMIIDCNFDPMQLVRGIEASAANTAEVRWCIEEMHRDGDGTGWFTMAGAKMSEIIGAIEEGIKFAEL